MKNLHILILLLFLSAGCKKENTPVAPTNEQVDPVSAVKQSTGNFNNGPYGSVSGTVKIYTVSQGIQLALEDFLSSNGPDLKVYLSKELSPVNFINLGSLKATSGNQLYTLPSGINASDYTYALIYCQQYSHLFGSAELKP